jgi:tetratricopeptide (TPR) repeat protein
VLNDLGGVYHKKRDYAAALAANQRAMAIKERVYGGDHPEVGYALVNMAIELKNLSRFDEVEKNYRRALGIFESKLGPDHFTVGVTWINLGEALRVWGRQEAALDAYGRARKILEAALGPEHIVLGHVWNGVGQSELARGRLREAQAALEHAVSLREKEPDDADPLAESRFALARALVAQGGDRARARKLAEEARAGYASLGDAYHDKVVDVERWLAR